jgi:hypothetical protein
MRLLSKPCKQMLQLPPMGHGCRSDNRGTCRKQPFAHRPEKWEIRKDPDLALPKRSVPGVQNRAPAAVALLQNIHPVALELLLAATLDRASHLPPA